MSNILIRKALIKDIESIKELSQQLIEYENEICKSNYMVNLNWSLSEEGTKNFKDFIDNNYIYVACIENRIIGYICGCIQNRMSWNNCKIFEIVNLYVSKDYRGNGIGTRLIEKMQEICKENHIEYLKLFVLCDNKEARDFYKKNGLYDYDLLMMKKIETENK